MTATISKPTTNARRSRRPVHLPAVMGLRKGGPAAPADHGNPCADCNGAESDRAQRILDEVDAQLSYRLADVLKAIDLLADSQRVLHALSDATLIDKELDRRISSAVDGWRNPMCDTERDGYSVLANLARVGASMADELMRNATAEVDRREQAKADAGA